MITRLPCILKPPFLTWLSDEDVTSLQWWERLLSSQRPVPPPKVALLLSWLLTLTHWSFFLHPLGKLLPGQPCCSALPHHWLLPVSLVTMSHLLKTVHLLSALTSWVLLPSWVDEEGSHYALKSQFLDHFFSTVVTFFRGMPQHLENTINNPQHLDLKVQTNVTSKYNLFFQSVWIFFNLINTTKTLNLFYICTFLYSLISKFSSAATIHHFFPSLAHTLKPLSFLHCNPCSNFGLIPLFASLMSTSWLTTSGEYSKSSHIGYRKN